MDRSQTVAEGKSPQISCHTNKAVTEGALYPKPPLGKPQRHAYNPCRKAPSHCKKNIPDPMQAIGRLHPVNTADASILRNVKPLRRSILMLNSDLSKCFISPPKVYSQTTRPATATTAAARLPTACWAPGAAAPVAPALALPVAVENVAVAEPVACALDAVT
jgi:hypothetical protein